VRSIPLVAHHDDVRGARRLAAVDLSAGASVGGDPLCDRRLIAVHPVDADDSVARLQIARRRLHQALRVDPLRRDRLAVDHQQAPEDQEREHDVDGRARADHDDPLPHRLSVVGAHRDVVGELLPRVHAGDSHVAPERYRADAVLRLAASERHERSAEEQHEALDAHPNSLRRSEVARLVQDDQRREADEREDPAHRAAARCSTSSPATTRASRSAA
jgi:hypothetical protein